MDIVHHIGQVAAVLLLLELLVVVVIFLAIAGGLAFGLHWVRGKVGWASDKGNAYLKMGMGYVHTGTGYAAKPVIVASGFADKLAVAARALRTQVRADRQPPEVAARPVTPPLDETTEAAVPIV